MHFQVYHPLADSSQSTLVGTLRAVYNAHFGCTNSKVCCSYSRVLFALAEMGAVLSETAYIHCTRPCKYLSITTPVAQVGATRLGGGGGSSINLGPGFMVHTGQPCPVIPDIKQECTIEQTCLVSFCAAPQGMHFICCWVRFDFFSFNSFRKVCRIFFLIILLEAQCEGCRY